MDKEDYVSQIKELKDVIVKQGKILDSAKGIYSPYLDRDIEEMQHLRENVLKKCNNQNAKENSSGYF